MKEKLAKLIVRYELRLAFVKTQKTHHDSEYFRNQAIEEELEEVISDLKLLLDFN